MAASDSLDCIRISQWAVQAGIGAYDFEQVTTQTLVLDLRLWGDYRRAALSDRLDDALDYAQLKADVEAWMLGRRWQLLEAFAEHLCAWMLQRPAVQTVSLTVDKPAAQAPALVSYTVTRSK